MFPGVGDDMNSVCRNVIHALQMGKGLLFVSKNSSSELHRIPYGIINLFDIAFCEAIPNQNKFVITMKNGSCFKYGTGNKTECWGWVNTIVKLKEETSEEVENLYNKKSFISRLEALERHDLMDIAKACSFEELLLNAPQSTPNHKSRKE